MSRSAQEIEDWLTTRVANLTGLPQHEIALNEPFARFGLDSVAVIALAADLETWAGFRFRANPLEDHPTISSLAGFLAEQLRKESESTAKKQGP